MNGSDQPTVRKSIKGRKIFLGTLAALFIFGGISWFMPLPGYLSRMVFSLARHGPTEKGWQEIRRHTDWFKRFFTGPPSDAEMIAYLNAHRDVLERVAILSVTNQCDKDAVAIRDGLPPEGECGKLLQAHKLRAGLTAMSFFNSIYNTPQYREMASANDAVITRTDREPQAWRGTHPRIISWEKSYVYVPPLIRTKNHSEDPLDRFRIYDLILENLDSPPQKINEDPYLRSCAVRKLDRNWYLRLCAAPDL